MLSVAGQPLIALVEKQLIELHASTIIETGSHLSLSSYMFPLFLLIELLGCIQLKSLFRRIERVAGGELSCGIEDLI